MVLFSAIIIRDRLAVPSLYWIYIVILTDKNFYSHRLHRTPYEPNNNFIRLSNQSRCPGTHSLYNVLIFSLDFMCKFEIFLYFTCKDRLILQLLDMFGFALDEEALYWRNSFMRSQIPSTSVRRTQSCLFISRPFHLA